jgi:hypothetical protein
MTGNRATIMFYAAAGLGLLALAVVAVWIAPAPYLHDFGEWLYQSQVLVQHWRAPEQVAGFVWAAYPVPNSLAVALLALLGLVLPGFIAGKLFLSLLLLAWYPLLWRLLDRAGWSAAARAPLHALLLALLAFSHFFWTGFVSYQLGLLLLALFLVRFDHRASAAEIALFGILLFFTHALPLLVFGLIVGIDWLRDRSQWQRLAGLLPVLVLGIWFVLGRVQQGFEAPLAGAVLAGWGETLVYKLGFPLLLGPFKNLLSPDMSSLLDGMPWLYWGGVVANALTLAGCGLLLLMALLGRTRQGMQQASVQPTWWWSAWLLLACYALAPYNFFGLINPGGRLLIPLLLLAVLLLGRSPRVAAAVSLVRWLAPPVVGFTLLVVATYLWLMLQAGPPRQMTLERPPDQPPADSVLAYNAWAYQQARYRYFNVRIFAFAERLQQVAERSYHGVGFRTGPLLDHRTP